ncbi:MAG: hypothetical protein KDC53_16645 [Saprospiraceae bacterium]|nr:hypothetical protein [Saprospiraceae bacterium]
MQPSSTQSKNLLVNILLAGMTLGTAWAVRGQFGHEQGAAWAGALGGMVIVILAGRKDWHKRFIQSSLAAAIGWGLGGMISYGVVVGYARALDFTNVYYGLAMLFVIGGLYGFMGGGLFALSLESSERKVNWGKVVVSMLSGGIIVYFFIIEQLGWHMTPPRSEAWAACLGMVLGLGWYFYDEDFDRPLHVALYSSLGGGFGFAFGNFLQVIGRTTEIHFNFWNVMEYSIGFFGGIGMAYGVFTAAWKTNTQEIKEQKTLWPVILFLTVLIPFVVWFESMTTERLTETYDKLNATHGIAASVRMFALLLIAGFAMYTLRLKDLWTSHKVNHRFFLGFFLIYILYSWLITGAWYSAYRIEQYLYIINFIVIVVGLKFATPAFKITLLSRIQWLSLFLITILFIAVLAWVALHSHGPWQGYQERFK